MSHDCSALPGHYRWTRGLCVGSLRYGSWKATFPRQKAGTFNLDNAMAVLAAGSEP